MLVAVVGIWHVRVLVRHAIVVVFVAMRLPRRIVHAVSVLVVLVVDVLVTMVDHLVHVPM